jgi:tRNA nucleotidyltransferase/poly(A) polymerase/very-short-patch-repair endonuclease
MTDREPADLDVVTTADSAHAADAIARWLRGHAFPIDATRGYHRVVMEEGSVAVIDVSQAEDVITDLARRDYTIDAMAAPILEDGGLGQVVDPFGGGADLEWRTVRMVDAANLRDDPLRLLRAVRLATELEMRVEPGTALTIRSLAPSLDGVAGERVRDELTRILATSRAYEGLRLADDLGLFDMLFPELIAARGVEQPSNHHYYDVFEHSIRAVAAIDEMLHDIPTKTEWPWLGAGFREVMAGFDLDAYMGERTGGQTRLTLTKLATLLHDVSKPETKRTEADGRIRFLGHPEQGAVKAKAICERLRFGNREAEFVSKLVEEHLRPTMLSQGDLPSRRALYRFFRDLGDAAPACLVLSLADAAAATGPRLQEQRWRGHVAYAYHVLHGGSELEAPQDSKRDRLLDGHALIEALGLEPGPEVGRILTALDEAQALGEITTRDEALELARSLRQTPPPAPSPSTERGDDASASPRISSMPVDRGDSHAPSGRWHTTPQQWSRLWGAARQMRHEPTGAEARLWDALRGHRLAGLGFRRQHAIGPFVVDFYCAEKKLVIEVDGPIHEDSKEEDAERQAFLEDHGHTVLRFKNDQVMQDLPAVLEEVMRMAGVAGQNNPSPPAGRGQGEGS